MRGDYVSLTLNQDHPTFITSRRSIWRSWKRLSRLQRNLIWMVGVTGLLLVVYIWKVYRVEESPASTQEHLSPPLDLPLHEEIASISIPPTTQEPKLAIEEEVKEILEGEEEKKDIVKRTERQEAVVEALGHAWRGYKEKAWGHDHLRPVSGTYHDWFHLGLTIIDSLDTLLIAGLHKEFSEAREWVKNKLKLNEFSDVNLFEVTIRVVGGLLGAFHLTQDKLFLDKAEEVGERLLPCFRSPSAIPYSDVNLASRMAHSPRWGPDSSTSEVTTLQLEFRDLSRTTNDPRFEEAAAKVSWHVHALPKTDGLVPIFINPKTGQFQSYADIKLGARGDSYYEYLLKQWIQTGKTVQYLRDDYLEAVAGVEKHLARRSAKTGLLFVGELKGGSRDFVPKMDHLVCYLPGTLALGYHHGLPEHHLRLAEELAYTCYRTYAERPTFLAPEITYFNNQGEGTEDMYVKSNDAHNLLRPELIESLWYLYQITGNTTYQQWGWNIFQAFDKYTKVKYGFSSIGNVNSPNDTRPRDMMESFFLGETLKYFYLLFADERKLIDIDKYVINTEAHPLPIYPS